MTLEHYAVYKDSGISWIGEIPSDWSIPQITYLTTSFNGATPSRDIAEYWNGDIPWMSSGEIHQKTVTHTKEFITQLGLENSSTRLLPKGTVMIALNGQGKTKGSCAVLSIEACCNQSLAGFVCNSELHNKWLFYCFESMYEYLRGEGGQAQRDGIAASNLRHERIPLPELSTQICTAEFLDEKIAEIDSLIEKIGKSIKLLEEYRKAVISETVTKGLDPNVPMKNSGIDWIGEMPEHWRKSFIKYEMVNRDSERIPIEASKREQSSGGIYPYYGASGIVDKIDDFIFNETLILIGEDGANLRLRNLPLIYVASGKYWVNNHAHILQPRENMILDYVAHQLELVDLENYLTGSAQPKLTQESLGKIPLAVPPIEEQKNIVDSLLTTLTTVDSLIEEQHELIEKISEYRKSLISEAVTGKFKIPGVE